MNPFSLALSEVEFVADWAWRVSPVVFVFKGTLAYLSYTGAGNAEYIKIRNREYFQNNVLYNRPCVYIVLKLGGRGLLNCGIYKLMLRKENKQFITETLI